MRKKPLPEGRIVETYHYGNSTVHISDACIVHDPDEIEKIIDNWHEIGWAIIKKCREQGIEV